MVIPRTIPINRVSCSNQYGSCSEDLRQSLGNIQGKSLKETKEVVAEMMSKNLFVKDYTYKYNIPDEIAVYVIVKKPKFTLQNSKDNSFALVDKDGMVLGYSENTTLPGVVFSGESIAVGESVNAKQLFSLDLVSSMYYYYQVKKGIMIEDRLEVRMPGGATVIFPLEGDRDVLLGSLRVVLSKIERVSTIDLRFKNPVLK
ncbi:MAG: hypothetical protein Q8P91_01235 [bacterium]|nr:hypothetical protein [bacterium]